MGQIHKAWAAQGEVAKRRKARREHVRDLVLELVTNLTSHHANMADSLVKSIKYNVLLAHHLFLLLPVVLVRPACRRLTANLSVVRTYG